jgi:hypothetical protein
VTEHSPSKPATSTDCHRNQSEAVENGPFRDKHNPNSKYTDESKQTGKLEYADEHVTSGFNRLHHSRQRSQASDHESQNHQVTYSEQAGLSGHEADKRRHPQRNSRSINA